MSTLPTKKNDLKKKDKKEFFQLLEYDGVKEAKKLARPDSDLTPELTTAEKNLLQQHTHALKNGMFAIVPLRCPGSGVCPFSDACPLVQLNKEPIGDPCPIEKSLAIESTKRYLEEFNINPVEQYSQYRLILMLSRLDVYEMRAIMQLGNADGALFTQENPIGVTPEGKVVSQTMIHKAWEVLDSIDNKRLKIMKALVATPQEQYKKDAALKAVDSPPAAAEEYAKIKAATDMIMQKLKTVKPSTIDAGETVVTVDE